MGAEGNRRPEPPTRARRQRAVIRPGRAIAQVLLTCSLALAACSGIPSPSSTRFPSPTCGGLKILIEGALPCERVAEIAIRTLLERSSVPMPRDVASIDVVLAECPRNEVPPQIACGAERFAQLATVTFGPAMPGGPIEPALTVAIAPVSGAVLGIANPLVR